MNILVTAGNTQVPIDRVRCITNIFTGRTGAAIAHCAWQRGHTVTLLTSHPEVVEVPTNERWAVRPYRTFAELRDLMAQVIQGGGLDAVIHCAAVSDYLMGGIYAPAEGTPFRPVASGAGKIKSDEPELWLRLVRAPKLVDCIRREWGFRGLLVKFKLEVGLSDEQLVEVAERSRRHSEADFMVANTLEGTSQWAFLGPWQGRYERVPRHELAERLLQALEQFPRNHADG
jgi:phosphopantothenate-cysteine ligase/phosphopantothenoylcysteine decarboxylase/phosphopantothenate--cysteine ligase